MPFIDLHCDALLNRFFYNMSDLNVTNGSVDFKRLRQGGVMAQTFAVCLVKEDGAGISLLKSINPSYQFPGADRYIEERVQSLKDNLAAHSDCIAQAYTADDVLRNWDAGKISAVLSMEDCGALNNDLGKLDRYHGMGFRIMGLTWNNPNCLGSPNSSDPAVMSQGLTSFGRDAVVRMAELGMLVDVSHLSDGGFYDVAGLCKGPFVATHSNCRAIVPHSRNLTDDMLRVLADHGGVAGINFGPEFLNENPTNKDSTVAAIVDMIKHMRKVAGVDVIAVGSDFDGIGGNLEIDGPDKLHLLAEGLNGVGFTAEEAEKICWQNALRVLR